MNANTLEVYRVEKYGEDSFRAVIGGRGSSHYAYVLSVNEHEARINAEWLCKAANEHELTKAQLAEKDARIAELTHTAGYLEAGAGAWEELREQLKSRIADLECNAQGDGEYIAKLNSRIAGLESEIDELESKIINGPFECIHCSKNDTSQSHWESCPKHPANLCIAELEAENANLEEDLGLKHERIAELKAENAALKPPFEVGQTVEYKSKDGRMLPCEITSVNAWVDYDVQTPDGQVFTGLQELFLPQPKVTKDDVIAAVARWAASSNHVQSGEHLLDTFTAYRKQTEVAK